ncbi:MAG: hypothetical protein ACLP2H_13405 [Terriglobales bacterium]
MYRFVNRSNCNPDGTLNSGVFSLRRDKEISLGIEHVITKARFDAFCDLKRGQGVARITVGDLLRLDMDFSPLPEPEWGQFSDAHGIVTGYNEWSRKKKDEAARKLRDIANAAILRHPAADS